MALYTGNPAVHHYGTALAGVMLRKALRTRNGYSASSCDQMPHMFAAYHMFGHQLMMPVPDLDHTDLLVIIGGNPLVSNGSIMTAPGMADRLKAIQRRGGRVVVIDPRLTRTAAAADQHHYIRPGTDVLLLLAIIHVIFEEGLDDPGHWRDHTDGVQYLSTLSSGYPPDRVAEAVGIPADAIRALACEIARAPSAAIYGRLGLTTQQYGGLCAMLLYGLNIITGNLDRPGGMMFSSPAVDVRALTARLGKRGHYDVWRTRVRGLPEFGGEMPSAALAEEIDTPGPGQIRALVTVAGNPVLSTPNGARLAKGLTGLDFMVSLDMYITATTRHADFILPPLSHLERDHFGIVFHGLAVRNTVKYGPRLFEPPEDARSDWEIQLSLAAAIAAKRSGFKARAKASAFCTCVASRRWRSCIL